MGGMISKNYLEMEALRKELEDLKSTTKEIRDKQTIVMNKTKVLIEEGLDK